MIAKLEDNILIFNRETGVGYDIDLITINGKKRIIADEIYEGDL